MAGTTLGTAYVQIVPSAKGIKGSITNALSGEGEAADRVREHAKAASQYGLSMNDYSEQAVSFGAALKSAYGGDVVKAAEAADTAIQDMADNHAKMGTDIESIQMAYQGFAKQNYTMLDNLKLGKTCQIAQYKPRENGETLALAA